MARRKEPDQITRDVLGFVGHTRLNEIAAYVAAGRAYRALADAELLAAWVEAFRLMTETLTHDAHRKEQDLMHEIELRGLTPPCDLVEKEFENFAAKVLARYEEWKRNPAEFPDAGEDYGPRGCGVRYSQRSPEELRQARSRIPGAQS
jgi:hypothetical protein